MSARARSVLMLVLAAAGCHHGQISLPPGPDAVIDTGVGRVRGTQLDDVAVYLGIPYAAPPVGALRWRPPVAAPALAGVFDATHPGPICPQLDRGRDRTSTDASKMAIEGAEDCLRLNVWTPAHDEGHTPVMVFVHGGGFQQGAGSKAYYDARVLAARENVVVVTINYRLGVLGMIAHEAFARESPTGSAGNYGILDQIAALHWVHDHIGAFGGDAANVTIFGESAGAVSVCALIASPLTTGLFGRAIVESGGGCADLATLTTPSRGSLAGFTRGHEITDALGCTSGDVAACMRGKDLATLVRADLVGTRNGLGLPDFHPVIDGTVLVKSALDRYRDHEIHTPLIVGSNAGEASFFVPGTIDDGTYEARVRAVFKGFADTVLAVFPPRSHGDAHATFERALTEAVFTCPAQNLARVAGESAPAYLYYFAHEPPLIGGKLGAFHGVELAYLFASLPGAARLPDAEQDVSRLVQHTWAAFARTGTPDDLRWPAYRADAPATFVIDTAPKTVPDVSDGRCAKLTSSIL